MSTLSFPGLGIGEFSINRVAFSLWGRDVAWYGVIITIGIICAFICVMYRSRQEGISYDDVYDYALFCIVAGIIGARAYYVLTSLDNYHSFYEVIAIWNGGLAIYGGIIGGILAVLAVAKVKKQNPLKMLDMIASAIPLAQAIGRWGNFVNAEAYGYETTLPWRMGIGRAGYWIYVHPTFLYESLWNLIGFLIINRLYKRKKYDGNIFLSYVAWYGFGRMFIEGLRADSLYVGPFRISQMLAGVTFLVSAVLLVVLAKKYRGKSYRFAGMTETDTAAEQKNAAVPASEKEGTKQQEEEIIENSQDEQMQESKTEDIKDEGKNH